MLPLGVTNTLRGLREGDTRRATIGAALLLVGLYRWARRRNSIIAEYVIADGDELRIALPKERRPDPEAVLAALAAADLDDDLLAAPTTDHEGQEHHEDQTDQ